MTAFQGQLLSAGTAQTRWVRAFDVLSDPVRRRILELLADGEMSAGDVTDRSFAESTSASRPSPSI